MKIKKPKNKIINFSDLYSKTLKMKPEYSDLGKYPQFRLSSSPFCPYKFIYDWNLYLEQGNNTTFFSEFFTGIGTSVHSTIQKWIPKINPGYILGNWKCKHCCKNPQFEECIKCTKNCKYYLEAKVGPKICPTCNRYMSYVEFHFIIPPLISGHCDGITLYGKQFSELLDDMEIDVTNTDKVDKLLQKIKKPIDAYVLEYKTSTRNNISKLESPKIEHKAQATMYAPCAQQLMDYYGLKVSVKGSIVKYISRDLPGIVSRDLILPYDNNTHDYFEYNINHTKRIKKAIAKNDVDILTKNNLLKLPCMGRFKEYYSNCKYLEECSSLREEIYELFKDVRKPIKNTFIEFRNKFKNKLKK